MKTTNTCEGSALGQIKLPPEMEGNVRHCGCCGGAGEYMQSYTYGCGMGRFKSMGNCDYCHYDGGPTYTRGCGLVYEDGSKIPKSVLNQIMVYNERLQLQAMSEQASTFNAQSPNNTGDNHVS